MTVNDGLWHGEIGTCLSLSFKGISIIIFCYDDLLKFLFQGFDDFLIARVSEARIKKWQNILLFRRQGRVKKGFDEIISDDKYF